MSPWAALILGAITALLLRALLVALVLWRAPLPDDLGDAGSGDSRLTPRP